MKLLPRLVFVLVAFVGSTLLRGASLDEQLRTFLAQPRFEGAMWGVKIVSLDSGQPLFEHQPHLRLSPASNSKLYTGALALARLGGDYRIRTPLLATAAVDAAGEIPGDLIVAGRADPSWGARETKPEFWSVFAPFIEELRRAGVKSIRGDIVADGSWLRQAPDGAGWTVDDMNYDFGAEISGVTLLDNFIELRVTPGAKLGEPCSFEVLEPLSGFTFVNHTKTLAAGAAKTVETRRTAGTTVVEIVGGVALDAKTVKTEAPVPRPAQWFAVALKAALERAGITVGGRARSVIWPEPPAHADVKIGEIVSPPLREMVAGFMKSSQNLETDLIFGHLGELRRDATTPESERSDELALAALKEFAREVGIAPTDLIFEEGSGLSRNNLTTADATARLLVFMAKHREADAFRASLPIAGVDGSLRKRMKGTSAENNVRAKTGGLRWAATLSGYATTGRGEHVAFSFMLNRYVAPAGRKAAQELDELAVMLASHGRP
jgi:D-alanyl-D-alanine carboxypeptidase/D-alanyl-D-alanine-endopeptidase (penicillin-binding protein 4)